MSFRSLGLVVLLASVACSSASEPPPAECAAREAISFDRESGAPPLVIVVIDGARWQDIFGEPDLTPVLSRMGNQDGAYVGYDANLPFSASGPDFVSLPGYVEMMTGVTGTCRDNSCPRTSIATVLDRAADAGLKVAAFSSWDRIDRAVTSQPGRFTVNCGDKGQYRLDVLTAQLALAHLETERPDVFFFGLGDTDEYAHQSDVGNYRRALTHADDIVGRVRKTLDGWGDRGRAAHILVTADHGRSDGFADHGAEWPESARSWMVASGPRIRARGNVVSPRARKLADLAPTMSALIGLSVENAPCGGDPLRELF